MALALASALVLLSPAALAQGVPQEAPPPVLPPAANGAAPVAQGWRLEPGFRIGPGYDSNLYATPSGTEGDIFLATTPSLRLERAFTRGELAFEGSLSDTRYRDHSGENSLDYRISGAGNFRIAPNARLFGGLSVSGLHEDRTSPDDVFGVEPTPYDDRHAHLGYAWRGAAWSLRTGATLQQLRYEDVLDAAGATIHNADRDRDVLGFGVRLGRSLSPRLDAFVQGTLDRREYRLEFDDNGFDRGSRGGNWALGLATRGKGRVDGEVYVGWLRQHYDDPRLPDVGVPTFGADLEWSLASGMRITTTLERTLYETTLPGASAYLDTSLSLRATRQFDERLSAWAELTAARSDFRGIARSDDVLVPAVGMSWRLGRHAWLDADYRLMQRRSDDAEAQYDRHLFSLALRYAGGASAAAAANAPAGAASAAAAGAGGVAGPSGFYLGAGIGRDAFATRVSGTRGEHEEEAGDYSGDFAGDGNSATLLAGYGRSLGRLYLAGELDLASSAADWGHDKVPDSRNFSADAGRELGLTLLAGWVLPGGAVASVSAGRRRDDFDSRSVSEEGDTSAQDNAEDATHYGIGLEVPLSRRLFVRGRYLVAAYDGYDVDADEAASDRFSGDVGRFLLELGFRFGRQGMGARLQEPGGFYAGVHGGDDRSWSHMQAVMRQSSQPQETDFEADFGDRGMDLGAFAGYGRTWGPLYGGLEFELDSSKAAWHHERLPNGRQFSIEALSGDGASLRLGYVTPSGALLYVRGGRVSGRFRIVYIKGSNPDAWIDRDDTLSGTRLGVGLEAPLSRHAFVRLDYTSTRYDDIAFVTTQTRADEVLYRNRQQLTRIGLGFRF